MIILIEPLSRTRMQLIHKEEELPIDISLCGKRHKLRQNDNINASEHIVIIMPFFRVMLIASRMVSIYGTNIVILRIEYLLYFTS